MSPKLSFTSSCLHHSFHLLACIKRTEVEKLNHWSGIAELWRIIRRRGELLDHFSSNSRCWLFHSDYGRVAEVALHKEYHFFISHKHIIPADVIQPSLH
jgi:hypothetical protein